MEVLIRTVPKEEWEKVGDEFHQKVLGSFGFEEKHKYDYSLLAMNESGDILGYTLVKEAPQQTIYFPFGGMLPEFRGKGMFKAVLKGFVDHLSKDFRTFCYSTKNTNKGMIKAGADVGFRIMRVQVTPEYNFLHHFLFLE